MSTLSTSIYRARHEGRSRYVHLCGVNITSNVEVIIECRVFHLASTSAKHVSIVIWSTCSSHLHIGHTNHTTTDVESTFTRIRSCTLYNTCWLTIIIEGELSYRTHGATAKDVMNHMTTCHINRRSTIHNTSQRVISALAAFIINISTATTTIHVATESISRTTIYIWVCNSDRTTVNVHNGIIEGVSILTTAIDGTLDKRSRICCTLISGADGDFGIIDPCRMVVARTRLVHVTTR